MPRSLRLIIQVLLFVLPWPLRRRLLQAFFGFEIHPTARIRFAIILAHRLVMKEHSKINSLTLCKDIDLLAMGPRSGIMALNYITGFPTRGTPHFKDEPDRKCELVLGACVGITSRQFIDCNGGVYIDDYATIAGLRTQILTHSVNVHRNRQETHPVRIGKYCFIGTGCIILPGAVLPDYCVLGAGAILNKAYSEKHMLYAGNPAKPCKALDPDGTLYFHRTDADVY